MKKYKIAVIGFPNAMTLDFVGPMDVFACANEMLLRRDPKAEIAYELKLYSLDGQPFKAYNGMQVMVEGSFRDIVADQHTMLVIAGGNGVVEALQNTAFIDWVRNNALAFARVLSICSSAFILAQAGLLTGKTITTHWSVCSLLQSMYPDVSVNENAIYLKNGPIYTSAGVSTGIDLSLAIVTEDLGKELAMQVAQELVLYLHRPGGQRQFSPVMALQKQQRTSFSELVIWMSENLHKPLDIDLIAEKACMSPRHFSRKFQQETGVSPMRFLNQLRLEKSRTLLEQKSNAIQSVAKECGFQSAETFRRQFHDHYGLSPVQYQGRF